MGWTSIHASAVVAGDALLLTMLDDDTASMVTARCLAVAAEGLEIEMIAVARGSTRIRPHEIGVFSVEDVDSWQPQYRPEASPTDRTGNDAGFMLRELKRLFYGRTPDLAYAVDPVTGRPLGLMGVPAITRGRRRVEEWMLRVVAPPGATRYRLGEWDRVTPYRTSTAQEREERRQAERDERAATDPHVATILAAFPGAIVREGRLRGRGGGPSIVARRSLETTGAPQRPATPDDVDDQVVDALDD